MKESLDDLRALRAQVDEIDSRLLVLIGERLLLAKRMGRIKADASRPLRDIAREQQVLRRLHAMNAELRRDIPAECINELFSALMDWSLKVQHKHES